MLLYLCSFHCSYSQQVASAALFGEHKNHVETAEANTYRIFMDMNGDFYPENTILDSELEGEGNSQLAEWAAIFPDKFRLIAEDYRLAETSYSTKNFKVLQDSIIAVIARTINGSSHKNQTWLVHGYRKKLYNSDQGLDISSLRTYKGFKRKVTDFLEGEEEPFYVEVFWDGKYQEITKSMKSLLSSVRLYRDHAIPNAAKCGYSLRKVFELIDAPKINFITHSTGSHLAASLLFNVDENYTIATPNQPQINIALIAAASPGKKLFKNYHLRNTELDFKSRDNYNLLNVYNEKDFVLKKGFLSKRYGNTSLGCNWQGESKKLNKYFKKHFPNSNYQQVAISKKEPNIGHRLNEYAGSSSILPVYEVLFK